MSDLCYKPLYHQIARSLRKSIRTEYAIGDRLPPEKELAAQYNVSLITIKAAISLLRQEKLVGSYRGKGTFVEKYPVEKNQCVAILIEIDYDHDQIIPYYKLWVEELASHLGKAGIKSQIYKGTLVPGTRPETLTCKTFLKDLERGKISGVIAVGTDPTLGWVQKVEGKEIPLMGTIWSYRIAVLWNAYGAIDLAVNHFLDEGRQRIAAIGWSGYHSENNRPREYLRNVLDLYGLKSYEHWFKSEFHPMYNGTGWSAFREIWTSQKERPNALLVLDSVLLPGVRQAVEDLNLRVPEDLLIISTNAGGAGELEGSHIVTLEQDPIRLAREMSKGYIDLVKDGYLGHRLIPMYCKEIANKLLSREDSMSTTIGS